MPVGIFYTRTRKQLLHRAYLLEQDLPLILSTLDNRHTTYVVLLDNYYILKKQPH